MYCNIKAVKMCLRQKTMDYFFDFLAMNANADIRNRYCRLRAVKHKETGAMELL